VRNEQQILSFANVDWQATSCTSLGVGFIISPNPSSNRSASVLKIAAEPVELGAEFKNYRIRGENMIQGLKPNTRRNMSSLKRTEWRMMTSGRQFVLWTALALVLATGLASANADTISESGRITDVIDGVGWLPQFNPTNGQLISVRFSIDGQAGGRVTVSNPTALDANFTLSESFLVSGNVGGSSLQPSTWATGDGEGYVQANSWTQSDVGANFSASADTSLGADLELFTGTDYMKFGVWTTAWPTISIDPASLSAISSGQGIGYGGATIEYTYAPVPEPSSLTLVAGGLALLGLRLKQYSARFGRAHNPAKSR
jgi:hypothetical protein